MRLGLVLGLVLCLGLALVLRLLCYWCFAAIVVRMDTVVGELHFEE